MGLWEAFHQGKGAALTLSVLVRLSLVSLLETHHVQHRHLSSAAKSLGL